jgi:hypothetical protein
LFPYFHSIFVFPRKSQKVSAPLSSLVVGIRLRGKPVNGRERQVRGVDRLVVTKSGEERVGGTVVACE